MSPISVKKIFAQGFVVTLLFPWVSFHTNSMDTQPWAFLFGCFFIFFFKHYPVNKFSLLIFLIPAFSLLVSMFNLDGDMFLIIRGVMSYMYLTIIVFSCILYFKSYGPPLSIIVFGNLIYIFFAMWQVFIGSELINIISPIRTTADRGVTSLAVEPTNLGIVLLVFSWFYLIFTDYKPKMSLKFLIIINIFSILFLAQSSMAALYSVLAIALFILYRISFFYLIIITCIIVFGSIAAMEYLPDARISKILSLISNVGVYELIYKDASINVRIASVIFPYGGLLENVFYLVALRHLKLLQNF
jgi:hypothetical protein